MSFTIVFSCFFSVSVGLFSSVERECDFHGILDSLIICVGDVLLGGVLESLFAIALGGDLGFLFLGARDANCKCFGNDSSAVGDKLFGSFCRFLVLSLVGGFQYVLS